MVQSVFCFEHLFQGHKELLISILYKNSTEECRRQRKYCTANKAYQRYQHLASNRCYRSVSGSDRSWQRNSPTKASSECQRKETLRVKKCFLVECSELPRSY